MAAEGEECKSDEGSALRNLNAIRVSERALVSELDPSRVGLTKHQGVIAPLRRVCLMVSSSREFVEAGC